MRILLWMSDFWPAIGGVEIHATKFLRAMKACGHEFIVIAARDSLGSPEETQFQGIPVYRFPFWNAYNNIDQVVEILEKISKLKRTYRPDLIHRNAVGVGDFFHLLTAHACQAPLLVTLHGRWLPHANALVTQTLRVASWVVGCSKAILTIGQQLAPEIRTRSSIVYNAMEDSELPPTPLPFEGPRLLCLGRMAAVKGFDIALHAMVSLCRRYPAVRVIMAGDGPERPGLEKQAADLGLLERVDFLGWVHPDKVPALINTATIVIMPSRFESFSIAALQAAHMGRPIVGTRVGGLSEFIVHRETGLLVDEEDSEGLASAIAFLLDHPDHAIRMGEEARIRVKTKFGWRQHINTYDDLYRKMIKEYS